jgi:hypothetical protein
MDVRMRVTPAVHVTLDLVVTASALLSVDVAVARQGMVVVTLEVVMVVPKERMASVGRFRGI